MTNDFYCDEVLSGNTEVKKVLETDHVLAYHHTRPFYPVHIVAIPKSHISSLITVEDSDNELLLELMGVIRKVAAMAPGGQGPAAMAGPATDAMSQAPAPPATGMAPPPQDMSAGKPVMASAEDAEPVSDAALTAAAQGVSPEELVHAEDMLNQNMAEQAGAASPMEAAAPPPAAPVA